MNVRTRLAPSPTGYMHIGTLRTALYNYFFAKKNGGEFILRIEDTDRERFVEGATESLVKTFNDLGITFDEGPIVQSDRLDIYESYAQKLIASGKAYYDFATKEELDAMREAQRATKQRIKYDRSKAEFDADRAKERIAAGEKAVIRLLVPEGETSIQDLIRGTVTFNNADIDDQVLMKSDGYPTYHLAVVVDDHEMDISHVIRGEEWLPSTPKHVLLYKAFGWDEPVYAHVPLLLNPDKTKLSKRQGDVSVEDYLQKGYVKAALLNFIATLGFNPSGDREIYSMQELTDAFELEKVNKAGAVLNKEKLDWMNNQYMKTMDLDELLEEFQPFSSTEGAAQDVLRKAVDVERERAQTLVELNERVQSYAQCPDYRSELLVWKKSTAAETLTVLKNVTSVIEDTPPTIYAARVNSEIFLKKYVEEQGLTNGEVLWPIRVALSGQERSASPFDYMWALGEQESVRRLHAAVEKLEKLT